MTKMRDKVDKMIATIIMIRNGSDESVENPCFSWNSVANLVFILKFLRPLLIMK